MTQDNESHGSSTDISRRRLVQFAGAGSLALLAGCTGGDSGANATGTGEGGGSTGTDGGSGSTDGTQSGGSNDGGSLTVLQSNSPPEFDPILGLGISSAIIGQNAFSTLYTYDDSLELVGADLVTGLPETENDGQRYVVELVDDATFHNGDPVTAEDVIYSFQAPIGRGVV
ncbi:ABC transporter substrate-binding protein, partial [Halomarina oriensis]